MKSRRKQHLFLNWSMFQIDLLLFRPRFMDLWLYLFFFFSFYLSTCSELHVKSKRIRGIFSSVLHPYGSLLVAVQWFVWQSWSRLKMTLKKNHPFWLLLLWGSSPAPTAATETLQLYLIRFKSRIRPSNPDLHFHGTCQSAQNHYFLKFCILSPCMGSVSWSQYTCIKYFSSRRKIRGNEQANVCEITAD